MAQVWGTITAFGTAQPKIHSGSQNNFDVVRVAAGIYLIDFKDGVFTKPPALCATQQYSGNDSWEDFGSPGGSTLDNVTIIALDNKHVKLKTGDMKGVGQDRNFSFIAIGD
jgi:hypothetical protein